MMDLPARPDRFLTSPTLYGLYTKVLHRERDLHENPDLFYKNRQEIDQYMLHASEIASYEEDKILSEGIIDHPLRSCNH